MNKIMPVLVIVTPLLLSSCVTETVYYAPAYKTRYVSTVGYYNTPYWNNAYYYGYDDVGSVGYWGMYDSYRVY